MPETATLLASYAVYVVLTAAASTYAMPSQYRSSPRRTFTHHVVMSAFVPVLGGLGLIVLALYARALNRPFREHPYSTVRLPVFTAPPSKDAAHAYGAGSIRSRLTNAALPADVRLQALLAAQAIPGNLSTRLLHEVLSDPSDDLRLTAYGMLDRGEKHINLRIQKAMAELERDLSDDQRGQLLKQLASHYWELVYQGYAQQGELYDFALKSAYQYALDALVHRDKDGELWVLTGRIALARHEPKAATFAFVLAQQLDVPPGRVEPYLAELAFERRDFATVRELVRRFGRQEVNFSTQPVIGFWSAPT